MLHVNNEKRKKKNNGRNRIAHQERIRTFGEKENYMYLKILEVNTIKQAEMKGKIRK